MQRKACMVAALLIVGGAAFARDKVVERSGRQPDWAKNMMEQNFIIVSGDGTTPMEAQQRALLLVKQEVVRGVAEQVVSASSLTRQEADSEVSESATQRISTKAAKVPLVQGIALNQVADVYWEKWRTDSKGEFYRYYIKYPFSKAQMSKLVAEFKAEEAKISLRLDELEESLARLRSPDELDGIIAETSTLAASLDDGARKNRASLLLARCRALCDNIGLQMVKNAPGHFEYQLTLGDKAVASAQRPTVTSACATITQVNVGASCSITYTYDGCYPDVENFIKITYRFGGKMLVHKQLIPLQ